MTRPIIRSYISILFIVCLVLAVKFNLSSQDVYAHFVKADENDIGPVCGMPLDKHPEWTSVIMFKDGTHVKLHGPKHMFIFYYNMDKNYRKHARSNISTMHVIDYSSLKNIKAGKAFYVIDCNVAGPMGDDLIPFKDITSAQAFIDEHGGEILTFDEVTPEVINSMNDNIPLSLR